MAAPDDPEPAPAHEDVSLEELLNAPLCLSAVEITGLARTKRRVVDRMLAPVLARLMHNGAISGPGSAFPADTTFADVVEGVSEAVERLRQSEVFHGAEAVLDRSPVAEAADLRIHVREKKFLQLRTGTSISASGGAEGDAPPGPTLSGSIHLRNVLGECESAGASVSWGAQTYENAGATPSNSVVVDLSKPYPVEALELARAKAGVWTVNNEARSSYVLRATGGEVEFVSSKGLGTLVLENTWRDLSKLADDASVKVREEAGESWKQAIRHTLVYDDRDDPAMPKSGAFAAVESEAAGLLTGDVRFLKQQVELQYHISNAQEYATLSASVRAGAMLPLPGPHPIRINDRFFIGGPAGGLQGGLRGFRTRGIGPRDGHDALGGGVFYTATVMGSVPVPEKSIFGRFFAAHAHVFASVGDLAGLDEVRKAGVGGAGEVMRRVRDGMRASVGVGLAMSLPFGRAEVNLCHVLRATDSDLVKHGVQVGLTQSFG